MSMLYHGFGVGADWGMGNCFIFTILDLFTEYWGLMHEDLYNIAEH